jgi:hypothetical protein
MNAQPAIDNWLIELARVSVFAPVDNDAINKEGIWKRLTGADPELRTSRPAEGLFIEEGNFGNGRLIVIVAVGRIDFLLQTPPTGPDGFQGMTSFSEAIDNLQGIVFPELGRLPNIDRLAFGCVALLPAASKDDAYTHLDRLLPSVNVSLESSDFMYQVNRPRQSASAPSLRINRLTKWAAVAMRMVNIEAQTFSEDKHAVRLEVDINTVPSGDTKLAADAINELIELAQEILANGDI